MDQVANLLNTILEFFRRFFGNFSDAISPLLSIPTLVAAGILAAIAWVINPGTGVKRFNHPIITMILGVVAIFLVFESLTILAQFGWRGLDSMLITLIILMTWMWSLAKSVGTVATVVLYIVGFIVLLAILSISLNVPGDSLLGNAIGRGWEGLTRILDTIVSSA